MKPEADPFGYITLRIPAIRSPNYVLGATGWTINQDGSAEFNNLTIRGTFFGTDFEITSAGIFFYSGTPALGNLVISLAFVAGSDAFGNGYPAGLQILNHGGANAQGIAISYAGTQPLLYFLNSVANTLNDPALLVNATGALLAQYATLVMSGAEDTTQKDYLAIALDGSSQDGTHLPTFNLNYVDPSAAVHTLAALTLAGFTATGSITAVQPGTGGSRASVAVAETWHSSTSLLAAGWTTTGAGNPLRYRKEGIGGGVGRLDGQLLTVGAGPWPAGGTILTLPSGYQPSMFHSYTTPSAIDVTANGATVQVFSGGAVKNPQTFTAAGQALFFDGVTFPLD